jgi:hypothetical protein
MIRPCLGILALVLGGCVTRADLAAQLRHAAVQDHLPKVLSCWETTFEASGFRGEYLAVVDFTVGPRGEITAPDVRELWDEAEGERVPADDDPFRSCLLQALGSSNLGAAGVEPGQPVRVTGYRLLFSDGSKQARKDASERSPSILIGPRADRCKGLYGNDPPRDAATLASELAAAEADVARARDDRDKLARELQRSYDVALELRERLTRDAEGGGGPEGSHENIVAERERIAATVRRLAAKIGCTP